MSTLGLKGVSSPRLREIREKALVDKKKSLEELEKQKHKAAVKRREDLARELLDSLITDYPLVFDKEEPMPFTVGIYHEVRAKYDSYPTKTVRLVLHRWCRRKAYREALAAGGSRYGLDGKETDPITDDQIAFAKESL